MRSVVGVVVLCLASWAASLSSQPPPITGEPRQDQKGGSSKDAKTADGPSSPRVPAVVESKPRPDQTGTSQKTGENGTDWHKVSAIMNAAATVLIAIFTGFLVYFGRSQANAMRKSVEVMQVSTGVSNAALEHAKAAAAAQLEETRRANELTLRAWVLVESADYTEGDRAVSVTVRNYGKLPATQVVALHKLVVGPTYLYPEPPDGAAPELGVIGAIGAGLAHTYEFPLDHVLFDELAAARRGERRGGLTLHLFSRFRYTDPLGTRGHTTYSAVLGGGRSSEIPGGSTVS